MHRIGNSFAVLTHIVALLAFPVVAFARQTTNDQQPVTLRNLVISADGEWMAVEEHSARGEGNVRVLSTNGDVTYTIERGENLRFSRDSRWVSALQKPLIESRNGRAGRTLVLLNLQDGSQKTFDDVLSYDVSFFSSHLAYLQSPTNKADEKDDRKGATLHVAELVSDRVFTWQNVTQYAIHQSTDHGAGDKWKEGYAYVAFVSHNEETGHDSLEIAFVGHGKRGWGSGGTYDGEKIESLCWARDSVKLAFQNSTVTTEEIEEQRVSNAIYTWHDVRGLAGHREFTRVDKRQ